MSLRADAAKGLAQARRFGICLAVGVLAAPLGVPAGSAACDATAHGLQLPTGFCASVFADNLGFARHLTVSSAGDVYVMLKRARKGQQLGDIVALRDEDGDGRAEVQRTFGGRGGDDIEWREGALYISTSTTIERYELPAGRLVPARPASILIDDLPNFGTPEHDAKPFVLFGAADLLVHIGAPSNSCQRLNRVRESPGVAPCPLREVSAGIWRFKRNRLGQHTKEGQRFSQGIRHGFGMAQDPVSGVLYFLQHGRDSLHYIWPGVFSEQQSAYLPSDEMLSVTEGSDFGWPYCFHDPRTNIRVRSPEYGGDGTSTVGCDGYPLPVLALPSHSAPNDLLFYTGVMFPARYRGGAFIALHGGWGRTPFDQAGYQVVFAPFGEGRRPQARWDVFADGFAGTSGPVKELRDAKYRPVGLAAGPDGALFISDSRHGRIWRVSYQHRED